jgi:LacI family transcriptional regulator
LGELGERGVAAGDRFAVVGFDGVADAAHSNPPLTTIAVDPGHIGEVAAETLLRRLREPDAPPMRHVATPKLVVRQSSGKA